MSYPKLSRQAFSICSTPRFRALAGHCQFLEQYSAGHAKEPGRLKIQVLEIAQNVHFYCTWTVEVGSSRSVLVT